MSPLDENPATSDPPVSTRKAVGREIPGKRREEREREEIEVELRHKNDLGDTPETIDERNYRSKRPLPRRPTPPTISMPEPDPATYVREPTHIVEYPYSQLTRSGEDALEVRPSGFSTLFSNHTFSRSYTPTSLLLKNMTAAHRERIEELSDSIIAVIPFLAGPRWETKYQDKAIRALELFLRGIDFPDKGHVNLSMSIPASDKDRRDFGGPWVIILEDVSAAFRMWLLDLGLISLTEPGATFLIESFSKEKMSWVICNYTGSGVSKNPDDIARALTEIKQTIWKREAIRKLIANYVDTRRNSKGSEVEAAALAQKSIIQILDDLTSSWRLIFIKCNNKEGDPNPRLQLQGKPISNQAHEQQEWLKTIRAIVVYAGFKQLKPDSKVIGCVGCKAETHPSWACPYPIDNTDRWLGPTADEYEKMLKNPSDWKQEQRRINNDFSQSDNCEFTILHGRGQGRGRGGFRGGGGRGRGGPEYPRGYSATRGRGHFGGYDYVG